MLKIFSLSKFSSRLAHPLVSIAILTLIVYTNGCARTETTTSPSTTTGCCPALVQTNTSDTTFIDGFMSFAYDSDTCRTMVTATCTSEQNSALNAGIVVNTDNFLAVGVGSVSFPGTCDSNNQWEMGNPPLVVNIIQCQLTQG